jgi:anti-anti-sigma regulatory factor
MITLTQCPMTIRLAEQIGSVLLGRGNAERFRQRVERAAESNEHVILDFEGILTISPSFADELFAKLDPALRHSGQVEVRGMSPALESIERFVVAGRPGETRLRE